MTIGLVCLLIGVGLFLLGAATFNLFAVLAGIILGMFGLFVVVISPVVDPAYSDECSTSYAETCR